MRESLLIKHLSENLWKIDSKLELIGTEVSFRGGRYDILARNVTEVAIEVKANNYCTNTVAAQLQKYANSLPKGAIYFVAPKVKEGIPLALSHLKSFRMFEIDSSLNVKGVYRKDLDDSRGWPEIRFPRLKMSEFIVSLMLQKLLRYDQ